MAATLTPEDEILRELEGQAAAPPPSDSAAAEQALLNESVNAQIDKNDTVPAGQYLAKFIEIEVQKSQVRDERDPANPSAPPVRKGGNLMLNCKLEILQGECAGRFVYDRVMLVGKGASRMAILASALGFYDDDLKCLSGFEINPPTAGMIKARVLGQVVGIDTEIEPAREWNGKKQPPRATIAFNGYFTPEQPESAVAQPSWE